MRFAMRRPVALPVDAVRRALADPLPLIDTLAPRLEPLPSEPGMAGHWRITAHVAGTLREGRLWLPAPQPADACTAQARAAGVTAGIALSAQPDGCGAAQLCADIDLAASGVRGRALLALLAVSEAALHARLEMLLDRLAAGLAARDA